MTATHNSTADEKQAGVNSQSRVIGAAVSRGKPKVSASERWVLISKNVYSRAQRRGFVGGDPFEDVAEAIQEVDDEYATDIRGLMSLTDPAELVDQFRNLFAGFGLEKRSLDQLLAMHRDALEKLAESNHALVNGAAERAANRVALLSKATEDAMNALRAMARTATHVKEHAFLPSQPTQRAFRNVLSRLAALANSLGDAVENGLSATDEDSRSTQQQMEIHAGLVKAYDGMTPAELTNAPIDALKGVSRATGERLASVFGMKSIRDMASIDLLEQAQGIVTLADAEQSGPITRLADGPVLELDGITARQAAVLRDSFRIETIRDFAQNKFFRLARAIVVLAHVET
jgi:hypothetical protein